MAKKSNKIAKNNNSLWLALFLVFMLGLAMLVWQKTAKFTDWTSLTAKKEVLIAGTYRANLPAAAAPGRTIALELQDGGGAVLTQDYGPDDGVIVESGTWSKDSGKTEKLSSRVVVQLTHRGADVMAFPQELIFEHSTANAGSLQLVDYDQAQWGTQGLTLQNTGSLINARWIWVETVMSDGAKTQADEKQSFSLRFDQDGRVAVATDCNNGMGAYALSQANGLEFGPLASTMMFCQGSQETVFFGQLSQVDSYLLEGDRLHLLLKADSGTMTLLKGE